ncbi:hypothetical protein [Zhihengliuella salsuginis]|uniref:RNA polymerase sigma factor n=1 Tax=Zhihengliuella salsuginis TaxID=578222 RepID=A0ABQ3GH24_9MICC|nr:hypothetical protein [Zhihengliuella salsuginis]GHD04329.1 RNA polymerase sigma factor [Zhihengliuella salsuginis]
MADADAPRSDVELVERVRSGDDAAVAALWERHRESAVRAAQWRSRAFPGADADDAAARAFESLVASLQAGSGPVEAVRPYLLTAVSRTVMSVSRGAEPDADPFALFEAGDPDASPVMAGLDARLLCQAFLGLPERWQSVLWLLEVEGEDPADAGTQLASSPETVDLLALLAMKELRSDFLDLHTGDEARAACRRAGELPDYVRGELGRRAHQRFQNHSDGCASCSEALAHLEDPGTAIRQVIAPLFVGRGSAAPLGLAAPAAAAPALTRSRPVLVGTGIAAAAALVLSGGALASTWWGDPSVGRAAIAAESVATPGPSPWVTVDGADEDSGSPATESEGPESTAESEPGIAGNSAAPSSGSADAAAAGAHGSVEPAESAGDSGTAGDESRSRPAAAGGPTSEETGTAPRPLPSSGPAEVQAPAPSQAPEPSPTRTAAPAPTTAPAPSPTRTQSPAPAPAEPAPAKPTPRPTPSPTPTLVAEPEPADDCLIDLLGVRVCI